MALGVEYGSGVAFGAVPARLDQRWGLFITLVVLNILDVITTGLVIARGGRETNPLIEPIVHDLWAVSILKALVLGIIAALLVRSRGSSLTDTALTLTTGFYIAVVAWNTTVLAVL